MDPPVTRYVQRDGHALAYQVVGDGDHDVIWYFEIGLHLDLMWTDPHLHYLFERMGSFARNALFQRRGFGLSDPVDHIPTLEQQADDILAVMDATGMRRATVVGISSTCGAAALLAARSPDRVAGLVLQQPFAERVIRADGALSHGWTTASRDRYVGGLRRVFDDWGSGALLSVWDATEDSPFNRRLMAMLERCSATPATARAHLEWLLRLDYSSVLPSIQCPTLVLWNAGALLPEEVAGWVAETVPDALLQTIARAEPGASLGEAWTPIMDQVERAVTGHTFGVEADRYLASVLFTDVVGSTETLARLGDVAYRDVRAAHERQVRLRVEQSGGRLLGVAGDGTFSVFDGPVAALRCARLVCDDATDLDLVVRAGVHSGQVQRTGSDLTGMTVHIGARICAAAGPGEVLVSRTARDLVAGSGLAFRDRGTHTLRGVPGRWPLYALADHDEPATLTREPLNLKAIDRAVIGAARRAPGLLRAATGFATTRRHRRTR
ncbi:adenylate/guanylate cyclase domain-containing protein [Rhodococcus olei]|uniref:Adenylate/guanylate cyclase domain-containing protein n=1 Tax=Rhodococcus olei TaxID=2161675 RepID=A0ABP8PDG5_9NOCA